MPTITFRSPMPVTAAELYAWHRRPGAFARLTPPWEHCQPLEGRVPLDNGTRWIFHTKLVGPITRDWIVEHFGLIPDRQFGYRQVKGSFHSWQHTLRFMPEGEQSILENEIDYELPGGTLGRWLGQRYVRQRLERMFAYRQRIAADDLARHAMFKAHPRLNVAITGSRGLIGTELVNFLVSGDHRVLRLVHGTFTKPAFDDGTAWQSWQPTQPLPPGMLKGVDVVINLAGENIVSKRWSESRKHSIRDSRVIPTKHLANAINRDGVPTFLSGSAIGIYSDRGDEVLNEESMIGRGFLAEVCREWEAAAAANVRVVNLRTGLVLSPKSGALAKLLPAFRFGGGAMLGRGGQFVSWIGIQDIVYAIHHILMTPSICGPVNLCAPTPVTNRDFGRTLAKVLHRPYFLTAPRFVLKILFGEMADEALLASQHAFPAKLLASGYTFSNDTLEGALRTMLP